MRVKVAHNSNAASVTAIKTLDMASLDPLTEGLDRISDWPDPVGLSVQLDCYHTPGT